MEEEVSVFSQYIMHVYTIIMTKCIKNVADTGRKRTLFHCKWANGPYAKLFKIIQNY